MLPPTGTMTRVYSDMGQFQSDAATLAPYGWTAGNVVTQSETNGCLLTFLLVAGLLLTPVCVGVILLLLIPTAFSKSVTVVYFYNPAARVLGPPSMGIPLPVARPPAPRRDPIEQVIISLRRNMLALGRWLDSALQRSIPSKVQRYVVYVAATAALILLIFAGLAVLIQNALPTQYVTNTSTETPTATAVPTVTSVPTPTGLIGGPTVGGTNDAFNAAFGFQASQETWSTTVGGRPAQISITTQQGTDGQDRAAMVQVEPPPDRLSSQTWDLATLSAFALRFVPPNATPIGQETGSNGETVHDLHSDLLAATFPPSAFTNESGSRQVDAGTLNWSCYLVSRQASRSVNICQVSIGTYN